MLKNVGVLEVFGVLMHVFLNLFEQQYLPSQWLTFRTFWDSIFSRENKVQTFLKGPLAK